jgi:hypothetical protein
MITRPNRQRSLTMPLVITETVLCNVHTYNILMVLYWKCYYYTEKFYSVCYNDQCFCQKFTIYMKGQ